MDANHEYQRVMKQLSREQMWEVWQKGKAGEELNEEEARMYEVMEGHLQYGRLYDRLNVATDEEILQDGVNVVLHITFHTIIQNQLAIDNPPAVRQVLRLLMQKGLNEHEAAHALAGVMAWEMHGMMKDNRLFDEKGYVRALRKLPLERDQILKNSRRRKK